MLEKIGLPAKPSLRGNIWVVDASHCQGCSSQFTFINRKHHCRRCGGIFCNTCTQQRMILRGQGDSPVRICEPCKKLEEAARFELRHGYKSRAGRGSLKPAAKDEDDILNQILGADRKESSSSGIAPNSDMSASVRRATSSASSSTVQAAASHDVRGEVRRSQSVDQHMQNDKASSSPEELRQQALEEKRKYKILKGEGKSEEALRAFKRGKELERQAESLEIYIRKNRKKNLASKNKSTHPVGRDKDDLAAELRELGWSEMDLHDDDKRSASVSLEGELSSLLGEIPRKTNAHGTDKTEVVAIKKKALMLKREGKLAEAKEELKRAKILEKQLEEQELLAGAEDSDDELSAIIQSMDNEKQDDILIQYEDTQGLDFDHLVGTADDLGIDSNFEVTDNDMGDPEIASALKSVGWEEVSNPTEDVMAQSAPVTREALLSEIHSLKSEALSQKRAGNVAEAMAQLKKAKLLEKDLERFDSVKSVKLDDENVNAMKEVDMKLAPKSRLTIQKELLGLKKKALALRREGRLDEAEEELKKGKILERQLEEMENTSNIKTAQATIGSKGKDLTHEDPNISETHPIEGADVTDQDMHDPTYLSILRNLGWNENDDEPSNFLLKHSKQKDSEQIMDSSLTHAPIKPVKASKRTKAEIQRELLGLKRKALSLRRQGNTDEAEEVLETAKALEAEMAEMEAPKKVVEKATVPSLEVAMEEADEVNITENDMTDPALLSVLKNLGWKDEELEPVTMQEKNSKNISHESLHSGLPSKTQPSSAVSVSPPRSKGEIQRELLGLKRKALALRRNGQAEEAEELLQRAKVLEAEMAELEAPKSDLVFDSSKNSKSGNFESFTNHGSEGNLKNEEIVREGPVVAVGANEKVVQSSTSLRGMENDTQNPTLRNSDIIFPSTTRPLVDNQPSLEKLEPPGAMGLLGGEGKAVNTSFVPPPHQSANIVDLLTGNDQTSSQMPQKLEEKGDFGSNFSSVATSSILSSSNDVITEDEYTIGRSRVVNGEQKPYAFDVSSGQGFTSQNSLDSLRQGVLSHKKKALALKRDGKLAEAREELRQAKLLEKSLAEHDPSTNSGSNDMLTSSSNVRSDVAKEQGASSLAAKLLEKSLAEHDPSTNSGSNDMLTSSSNVRSDVAKEQGASSLAPKALSGRDRFKLQQESLSHKRQALKLRREGRVQEAEAEFELAKSLEAQLEESAAHDSTKSSSTGTEAIDDVVVEDLLDPQLFSALKAIGLDDSSVVVRGPERPELIKQNAAKTVTVDQERIQLEERIKAEKVKALNLKRSGKQAEALDALRRAKMLEKKLNSLSS